MKTSSLWAKDEIDSIRVVYSALRLGGPDLLRNLNRAMWDGKPAPGYEERLVSPDVTLKEVRKILRKGFEAVVREALFVRAISILEVFLVDSVKWLFIHRQDLFHREGTVEIPRSELLATDSIEGLYGKLIGKECRDIQNNGIKEIRKYYKARFGIVFKDADLSDTSLDELFERRHIIVHRLGKTDARYRREFSTSASRIGVDETYLLRALDNIGGLILFVHSQIKNLAKQSKKAPIQAAFYTVRLELADIGKRAAAFLKPDHEIAQGAGTIRLRDVLVTHIGDNRERSLILSGPKPAINTYITTLRELEGRHELVIVQKVQIEPGQKCNLPEAVIRQIALMLRKGPGRGDAHKVIASELGLSNKQTYAAIAIVESNPKKYGLKQ